MSLAPASSFLGGNELWQNGFGGVTELPYGEKQLTPRGALRCYGGAVALAVLATVLRLVLNPFVEGVQFITFFPAVALAGYLFGRLPGLLAVLLCGIFGWYLFVGPQSSFEVQSIPQALSLFLYFVTASALAIGSDAIRNSVEREHLARLALQEQRDVAEEAEQRFRRSETRLLLAQRAARAVAWEWDFNTGMIHWSDLKTLHELAGDDLDWVTDFEQWNKRIHPDDVEAHMQQSAASVDAGRGTIEFRIIRNGEIRWIEATGEIVERSEDGSPVKMAGITLDVTARHLAQEHQQLLINELNHRVKNSLAVVQSLAQQTFRESTTDEARAAFEGRIQSLARAHDALTLRNWHGVGLREAVEAAIAPFQSDMGRGIEIQGPDVQLRPEPAISLGMAFHELATNATKHGALSSAEGLVNVSWQITEDGPEPALHLRWRESGGPSTDIPKRRGFGSRLIEQALAAELRGRAKILFEPDGVCCEIDAPLSGLISQASLAGGVSA